MNSENIASILKNAINASTTKIQNESKRTKVFVLPPELLKGLLIQNEISKVDITPKPETSNSNNSKKTTKNKNQSLEDSESTTPLVDQPKRASSRQRATSKGSKNTRSRASSKSNSKDLKNEEQNYQQDTVLENNETSDTSKSTEKIRVQKKASRRKSKAAKESEPSDHFNVESNSNTTLNEVQEKIEINHELQDGSIDKVSDKPSDNYCILQSSTEISDKIEKKCIENNHELQDCLDNEISNNAINENNLANTETVGSRFVDKSCDQILNVADSKTELDDQVLDDPCIEISQSDASQNILSGKKSPEVELNDEKQENVLPSEPIQLPENQEIIEEETYILEEIIELVESDEDSMQVNNDKLSVVQEVNIKTEKDMPVDEIKIEENLPAKEINSEIEGDLPINDSDVSKPIDNLLDTKTKCISKKVPVSFKPIVEQKRPNAVKVYVNRRKNRNQPNVPTNNDVQEKSIIRIKHNCDENSPVNYPLRSSALENSHEVPQNIKQLQEKTNLEINCEFEHNSLIDTVVTETSTASSFGVDKSVKESTLENSCEVSQNIKQLQEKTNLEITCDFEHNSLIDIIVTETSIASSFGELKFFHEIQEKSSLVVERKSDNNSLIDTTPKTDQLYDRNNTQEAQEQINVKTNCSLDQIILDSTILPETSNINSCKLSMQEEIVSVSENISFITNKEKPDDENKILNSIDEPVENLSSNHTENKEEIQSNDSHNKTINTHENLMNKTEHVEMKIHNTQSPKKLDNAKIDAQNSSTSLNITNAKMETDAESTENTKLTEFPKYSIDDNVSTGIEKNVDIASDKIETQISHKSEDSNKIHDYLKNENDSPIRKVEIDAESTEDTKLSEFPKCSVNEKVNKDIEKNVDIASDKIETQTSHESDDSNQIQDHLKNENDCPIKSLRQLRNRTKVIPIDPVNFHKLKNNIEQESLHLRNGDKSDIALSKNFEISHRTRSVSLNLESNSPEKLSMTPKKVSRKTKSIDNYFETANRTSFLRRRSLIPENETKMPSVLEHSDVVPSSESLSNETVDREINCRSDAINEDSNQSKILKDVDCPTMQNADHTEIQKAEEIIPPESNLNENLSVNTDELQNTEFSLQTAINKRRASLKNEKVIVVRKIQKGRRSKSSQPKDDSAVGTDMEKSKSKSNQTANNSTIPDKLVNSVTAKNKILSEDNMDEKSNDRALYSSDFQKAIEVNALKIKTEKVTPVKSRRGKRAKPIISNEITTENTKDTFDTSKSSLQPRSTDDSINHQETSSADLQVENVLEETNKKIKTEKVTPVKKGRGRRRSKSITNELAAENTKGSFDVNENSHHLEKADDLMDRVSQKADDDTILSKDSLDKTSESIPVAASNADHQLENDLEESSLNIKTEKVTSVKKGRRGRRPKTIPSNVVDTEDTKNNVDTHINSLELESVDSLNCSEQAFMNDSTAICNQKAEENIILSSDNLGTTFESTSVDASIDGSQIENASTEGSVETKSGKVSIFKRGRKGRRSKSKPLIDNVKVEKHHEDGENNTNFEALEYFPAADSTVTNDIVTSADLQENGENAVVSDNLNERSESNVIASTDSSSNITASKTSSVKKRRGRLPKNSKVNDSIKEKEIADNDAALSFVENNIDLEKDNVIQLEDAGKDNSAGNSADVKMGIDRTTDDNNATHDVNLDVVGTNNEVTEEPVKSAAKLSQRTSRQNEQEASIPDSMQHNKRSSRNSVKRNRIDSDDEPENDPSTMDVRKSGRRQRAKVNYCVPDEDVDLVASEARREPVENAPKRRRGRPSMAELLRRKAAAEAAAKESAELKSRESMHEDTNLNSTANDSVSSPIGASDTPSRRSRAVKSSINRNIFEVESEAITNEKSLDSSDQPQAGSVSGAEDDTNDFEDSNFSDKNEDEDFVEEPKPRRGRKRKDFFDPYKPRKRGRPKKNEVESNDEDYTPHHTYIPKSTKTKETMKPISNKKVVTCGKCGKEIVRHQWYSHNLFTHNDMAWMEGAPKPDFENDQKLLMRVLTYAHKKKNKKGLVCEMCREVKRSVVGFISHITFCGKTDEEIASLLVTCELCGGTFKPSSMEYHERQHRLELDVKKKKEQEMAEKFVNPFEPRSKRKAAEKAVTKISEFTATVKEDDLSAAKKLKLNSPHIKKFIQKPLATKKISSFTIVKWKKELDSGVDAACTQLGCQFTCKSMEEMREHYSTCNFTVTENYVCKICRFQTLFEDEIIQHAQKHTFEDLDGNAALSSGEGSSDEDYTDVDEDSSNQGVGKTQGLVKKFFYKESSDVANKMFKFIFNNGACHTVFSKTFLSGFQWTLEFERQHFKFNIFNNFVPNTFTLLDGKDAEDYLPELDTSMPVRFTKADGQSNESEWKNWSRFEGARVDDSPTFFVGGPIWAMAWAPTPSYFAIFDDLQQFLAISTHPTMDNEYAVGKSYSGKNIIQIWNLGMLNNRDLSENDPELSYTITHDGGTVWSLEWCPSGCYQHEDLPISKGENNPDRLGLLAAGCSDGCVRIYSLIFPKDLRSPSENQYPIYNTEPVAKLIVNTAIHDKEAQTWQVMKLCWSRDAGHNVIVAGFSNGYVAFWDLTTKSPLLKYQVDSTTYFRPYKQFFAHHHAVTMVALVPQDNKRYLATASLDKLYKFWDLEDTSRPKNTFKKSYVTDGCWFNNWNCAVLAHDEALCMGHNATVCLPLRDYTYKYYNLLPSNSTTYGVATSDFGNSVATGNVSGELLTLFPHQFIYIRDMERTIPPKRSYSLVSTADIVDFQAKPKNDSPLKKDKKGKKSGPYSDPANFMPSTYEDSKGRFGIQFNNYMDTFHSNCKKKQKQTKKQLLTCEHLSRVPIEQYPLKSINKVAWNPNASSFLWLAAGYQNGFVRLISFRSVASPVEWNKFLQSHTNELKARMAEEAAEEKEDC